MQNPQELRRKALMDQMDGPAPIAPIGGPSMQAPMGAAPSLDQPIPAMPAPDAAPSPAAPAPFQRKDVRLMEGDAGKLANVDHAKKSPKYDFLQLANSGKYGYDQLGDMLGELQKGPNAHHWQGWTVDRDKFKYTGDKAKLGDQWKGVTTVDAIGGFNSGNPQGFRWGADDSGAMAAAQGGAPQGGGLAPFGGQALDGALSGDPLAKIQQMLAQFSGSRPNFDALLAQLGGQ